MGEGFSSVLDIVDNKLYLTTFYLSLKDGGHLKKKLKIALSSIILTTTVSYLVQYWFKHSGLEDKTLNKLDDIKDIFNGGKK